jgi:DNA-binding IscR family transcriptional regulator
MKTPAPVLRGAIESLVAAGILIQRADHDTRFGLAHDPAQITLAQLILALRGEIALPKKLSSRDKLSRAVISLLQEVDSSFAESQAGLSLSDAVRLLDDRLTHDNKG